MQRSGGGAFFGEINVNSRHPLIPNVLADMRRRDRNSQPRDSEIEEMTPGSRAFLIFVGCVLLLCFACVLLELAGYQYTWIAGWPPWIYQAMMTLLGIGIFLEVVRLLRRLETPGSVASMLPMATLPTWLGLTATIYGYRNIFSLCVEAGYSPRFSDLAYGYRGCLSFVLIGLAASFPAVVAICFGLYVRVFLRQ
jgi:hypothetical protein